MCWSRQKVRLQSTPRNRVPYTMFFFEYSPAKRERTNKTLPYVTVCLLFIYSWQIYHYYFFSHLICHWCRVEFDAYRSDLEYYKEAPRTEINQLKIAETQVLLIILALLQCCGTAMFCWDSGSGSRQYWAQKICTKSCLINVRSSIISQKAESWSLIFDFFKLFYYISYWNRIQIRIRNLLEFAPCEGTGSSGPLFSRMSRTQVFHAPSHPTRPPTFFLKAV